MSIVKTNFGTVNGKQVYCYTLDNGKGLTAEILNYGGIIKKLCYKGVDVVLGRDTLEEYFENNGYFGALIGRNSNRIEGAKFNLNGKSYSLYVNDKRSNLHGGKDGFDKKVWDVVEKDEAQPALELTYFSADGEEGFPGNVNVKVTYTLTAGNSIVIHYEGQSDADTVLNMTNHSYFNLNGHNSGTVDEHVMYLNCDFYTPNTDECFPYGEVLSVKGTAMDFTKKKTMKEAFEADYEQIKMFGGIDHNFVINGSGLRLACVLEGDKTAIKMETYTDRCALQLYTGNVIDENRVCKDGTRYPIHGALCLETQTFPNNLKYSHFPTSILKKGEKYDTVTEYKFV